MDHVDTIVVGAGVIGLAVARALAASGKEVLILEAARHFGQGISARNSEVIHAGLYYPSGSLKATLCVRGRELLYDYAATRGIAHQRCGKLIVATAEDQHPALRTIETRAAVNGVDDLRWVSAGEARSMEPALQCTAALSSPSTGIIDSHALMRALLGDAERAGAMLVVNTKVLGAEVVSDGLIVETRDLRLKARQLINCAGLGAQTLAGRIAGLAAHHIPPLSLAKGNYFHLPGKSPFSRLIYPAPEAHGLGVHLTLDLGGQARFGPDVEWVETENYAVDPRRALAFYAAIRRYWPALPEGALEPAYAGIRPKPHRPEEAACDFLIAGPAAHGIAGLVLLFGMESPGLTAALAIGEHVAELLR